MALFINTSWDEDIQEHDDWEGFAIGSAMKEDLEAEEEFFEDDSMAIGSAMKEDLGLTKKKRKRR